MAATQRDGECQVTAGRRVPSQDGTSQTAKSWLVVGANGMLGHDLVDVISHAGHQVIGLDLPSIDITVSESVAAALDAVNPDVVVNAAAYTAVDDAEENEPLALLVNGEGPRILAAAIAARAGTRLVHLSTDYVFSGDATSPYAESAEPAPRSAYGRTKLAGEVSVRETLPDRAYVVRSALLYGAHGPNFVKTMLALESTRSETSVVDDQRGQPTWSLDLARQILNLVTADAPIGTYHGSSSGETTWFGLTREIFRLIDADPERVRPTTTAAFPRPARRPAYGVLGHDRWAEVGLPPIRDWKEALAEALPIIRG